MHITDWLEMLGEHFPLVVIGCAEALLAICAAGDMQSLLGVTFEQLRQDVMLLADALEDGQKDVSVWKKCCRHRVLTRSRSRRHITG